MSRRRVKNRHQVSPDCRYDSEEISKFINVIMSSGKKTVAERIVYGALDLIEKDTKENGLVFFKEALENIRPAVEVRSRRIGGANYQVPAEVSAYRQVALAMRWIKDAALKRNEKTMMQSLYKELLDAKEKKGNAFKKKEEAHKMAEANRAFSHYRW